METLYVDSSPTDIPPWITAIIVAGLGFIFNIEGIVLL